MEVDNAKRKYNDCWSGKVDRDNGEEVERNYYEKEETESRVRVVSENRVRK